MTSCPGTLSAAGSLDHNGMLAFGESPGDPAQPPSAIRRKSAATAAERFMPGERHAAVKRWQVGMTDNKS